MSATAEVRIEPAGGPLRGRVRVPGSKSLSTRALMLAALAERPVVLLDLLMAEDTERLLEALRAMGVTVGRLFGSDWSIDGRGLREADRRAAINLGDGGAPTRFAMALAAMRAGPTEIDGSARMRERPVDDGVRLLRELGVRVDYLQGEARLPVLVHGGTLAPEGRSLDHAPLRARENDCTAEVEGVPEIAIGRTASSQFVSALMLVAPSMTRGLRLRFVDTPTSASYLALSIDALRAFGARVSMGGVTDATDAAPARGAEADTGPRRGTTLTIAPGYEAPATFEVPADASSAIVWVAAAAMIPGSRVELVGVRRDAQPDRRAIEAIGAMGARLAWSSDALTVEHGALRGIDIDAEQWPDGALAVAAAATAASGATRLRSLGTLRVKESDRLAALTLELRRFGVPTRVEGDDLLVEATRTSPEAATDRVIVDTHRDHRIAMAMALVGLARGGVTVRDPGCVAKSYPDFWRHLRSMVPGAIISAV